ncbi:MAG: O-antigen ligase family protein [Chthoniobacteraceae bacterium]
MNFLQAILIFAAIVLTQLFFGGGDGTRLIYVLPAYLLLGLSGLLSLFSFWKAPARADRGCLLATAALALYFFARIALSQSAWLAHFDFFALLAALLVYSVTAIFVNRNGTRNAFVYGLLVLGLVQTAVGIYQFARNAGFNPLVSDGRGAASFRASGFFINPNHLAGFLEVALLLATSFFFWGGFKVLGKMLLGYLALVCLAGLVLTGSRGGYLSIAAGFAVFACMSVWTLRARMSRGMLPRIIGIVVAIVLTGVVLAFVADRSFAIRERANTVFVSSDVRLQLWEAAWKQFRLAPLFGTGSRSYVYYGRMFRSPQMQDDPVFAHNDWLQTLAEYGITGVALAAIFVFAHLRHGGLRWLRMAKRHLHGSTDSAENRALAMQIGTMSAVAACLVHAVMDFNLHLPANMLLIAFLFGTLAARRARADEEKPGWSVRALHAVPAGLGLWMLIVGGMRLPAELFVENARGEFATRQIGPALEDAGQALAWGARDPELYFQIGENQRILSLRLRSEEAKRYAIEDAHGQYAEALAIFPQDVKLLLRDAWALSRLGRFEEAQPLLAEAQRLDPNSPMVWIYSALHWKLRGRPVEALADYRRVQAMSEDWVPHVLKGMGESLDRRELEKAAETAQPADSK